MSLLIKNVFVLYLILLCDIKLFCQVEYDKINIYTENSFMLPTLPENICDLRNDAPVFLSLKKNFLVGEFRLLIPELESGSKLDDSDHPFMCYTIIDFLINEEITYSIYLDENHNYKLNSSDVLYGKSPELWNLLVDVLPYLLGAWR